MNTQSVPSSSEATTLTSWRLRGMGILRIAFGVIWAIDAWFKWQPDFIHNLEGYLKGSLDGQSAAVQDWINFWIRIVNVNPHVFAYLVAIGETAVAIGLLLGLLSNLTNIVGILLSIIIWATAEGFGGPYTPGSTDIGSAIIYVLVFVSLFLTSAGLYYGVDRWVDQLLEQWSFLASGSARKRKGQVATQVKSSHA